MLDNFTDLNRKIQHKCEMMSVEQDGDRMLVLAGELEHLFEQKDILIQDRNRNYRQSLVIVPPATLNL
jgi:hypothetical protein